MPVIGLTGSIASGKSFVSRILKEKGARILDADKVARDIVEPGTSVMEKIGQIFGPPAFNPDGTLNRKLVGQMVFEDRSMLQKLNDITHPAIIEKMSREIDDFRKHDVAGECVLIIDAALLIEVGMRNLVDELWVVEVSREEQLRRLMKRDGISRDQALARINSQMPAEEKRKSADLVIDNSGDTQTTRKFIEDLWQQRFGIKRGGNST